MRPYNEGVLRGGGGLPWLQSRVIHIRNSGSLNTTFTEGYRIQNTGYRTYDTVHRIQNTEYRTQNTEHRIQNIGYRT